MFLLNKYFNILSTYKTKFIAQNDLMLFISYLNFISLINFIMKK